MNIGRIVSRSLELMWKYKFLWLFGIVMGITGGGGGGSGNNFNARSNGFTTNFDNPLSHAEPVVLGLIALVALLLFLVWLVLFFYVRFVSRGAMVATVRDAEANGSPTLRSAWKEGRAFYTRLLGLGFLVNVPLALVTILIIVIALIPVLGLIINAAGRGDSPGALLAGLGITAALTICCGILLLIVIHFIVHPLYEFAVRAIVLEDLHVREGIARGIERVRENLGGVLTLYTILIAARIGWAILALIVAIPFALVFFGVFFAAMQTNVNLLLILGLIFGIPLLVLFGAIEGIFQTFESNAWTEAYLELDGRIQAAAQPAQ